MSSWSRLIRYTPAHSTTPRLGEPVDPQLDVGKAIRSGEQVQVHVYSGSSVLDAGSKTDEVETVGKLLSPVTQREVGTIRCEAAPSVRPLRFIRR